MKESKENRRKTIAYRRAQRKEEWRRSLRAIRAEPWPYILLAATFAIGVAIFFKGL